MTVNVTGVSQLHEFSMKPERVKWACDKECCMINKLGRLIEHILSSLHTCLAYLHIP